MANQLSGVDGYRTAPVQHPTCFAFPATSSTKLAGAESKLTCSAAAAVMAALLPQRCLPQTALTVPTPELQNGPDVKP
jgi:hypothetical protein